MGANISEKDLRLWLQKNNWKYKGKSKHEQWMYEIEDLNINAPLSINFNVKKGSGIKEYTLIQICKIMKIPKKELIKSIRENKKYSEKELINFFLISKEGSFDIYDTK